MQLCEDLSQQGGSAPPQAETTGTAFFVSLTEMFLVTRYGTYSCKAENLDPGTGLTLNLKPCRYYLLQWARKVYAAAAEK
jgi:hypothetical protein